MIDYQRIAKAITYINDHSTEQPNLDNIAEAVHLSPYHFHRLFKAWAGVTPKDFLQYISLKYAKKLLNKNETIEEAAFHTGLSSTSRLHDLFVNIEGMTPGEFKNGGENLTILYQVSEGPFGSMVIASTGTGICNLLFIDGQDEGIEKLSQAWPHAHISKGNDEHIKNMQKIFTDDWENMDEVKLHIQGTDFQLKVWEALLKIPAGELVSYSVVAAKTSSPKAFRAVGTALGRNPVAYLIPCHRVIKKVGRIGEYQWGSTRKTAIIGWEAAKRNSGH